MTAFYAVPVWLLLALVVVVAVALACGGLVLVRRMFPRVDFSQYNTVSGIVLGIVGALFTVTVAFIIAIVWQEFDGTSQRAAIEVGAAADLWHTAEGLSPALRREVRRNVVRYAQRMIDDEWPKMRQGGSSDQAEALLTATFEDLARFRPSNAGEANAQSAALQDVSNLHDTRHRRLDDNASGISAFEWTILAIGAIITVGMCYLVGMPDIRGQLVMTGAVAAMVAVMFVLIFELDYPFRGDVSVAPSGWVEFVGRNASKV